MAALSTNDPPTVGILGGGQLGRMLALAGIRMGLNIRFLAPKDAGPMQAFANIKTADWTEESVLREFASHCDVVTVESEWAPGDILEAVCPDDTEQWPKPATVNVIRHKGRQTEALSKAGLPLPDFARCETKEEAVAAGEELGWPVVAKQYRGSYDGYGNATADNVDEIEAAWDELADDDGMLVEEHIDFHRELSAIIARSPNGETMAYPVTHTIQRDHRCHAVIAPAPIDDEVAENAIKVARKAVETVNGVGVTAVELFELDSGDLLINELAPRPHNTGHYSIESCHTCQYENHLRGILNWPLGDASLQVPAAVMVNVLGRREQGPAQFRGIPKALEVSGCKVHLYDKPMVHKHRKMGHVTITGDDPRELLKRAEEAASKINL